MQSTCKAHALLVLRWSCYSLPAQTAPKPCFHVQRSRLAVLGLCAFTLVQVGKTLADSLHQSAGSSSLHRTAVSAADAGASPPPPHTTWHSHYNELALQLIARTTAAGTHDAAFSVRLSRTLPCDFQS